MVRSTDGSRCRSRDLYMPQLQHVRNCQVKVHAPHSVLQANDDDDYDDDNYYG